MPERDFVGHARTVPPCARALERNPPFAAWLRESGHDILGHGYRWAEVTQMTDEEREDLEQAMRVLPEIVGRWGQAASDSAMALTACSVARMFARLVRPRARPAMPQ